MNLPMNLLDAYELDDLKLVYRILHAQLMANIDLMDNKLLHDLQVALQQKAKDEGIDVADHGAWDVWLGNTAVPCDVRMEGRRRL